MSGATKNSLVNARQQAYARGLFLGLSQPKAYEDAGYSTNQSRTTIAKSAAALAKNPKVRVLLAELRAKADTAAVMLVDERTRRLSEIARANLTDFIDDDGNVTLKPSGALADYSVIDTQFGKHRRIGLRDPINAIQELNRMERVGTPDSVNNFLGDIKIIVVYEERKKLQALGEGRDDHSH